MSQKIAERERLAPLSNVLVGTEMTRTTEEATRLLKVHPFRRVKSYRVPLRMRLPHQQWNFVNTILDTGVGPNFIKRGAILSILVNIVKKMKPNRIQSAVNSSNHVSESIYFQKQLSRQGTRTGFLVVEHLVVNMLLGTALINKIIKRFKTWHSLNYGVKLSGIVDALRCGVASKYRRES